ncbi:uncharacterized protein LOC100118159 [Nasonia vitripennis]|uniref:Uncharacterized protein n=1 Tax=Nasonia vitripennis TaxID=7425 RepID=A0A7M7G394_NASVI|nr:uncharacterized protein LOC100118159 [Nasonia vitripennis]XP_016845720.1 uncharacterized protein LOC100118159 [Nasonia vitripennis]
MFIRGNILVYALFCISALTAKFVLKSPAFTRESSVVTYNPAVLRLNSHLVTVTISNSTINVTSTDTSFKPCQIAINPEDDHVNTRIQARALGNGKIIVWGYNVPAEVPKAHKVVSYVIFMVDPQSCTAQRVARVQDNIPNSWSGYEGYVVPYQDTFDVFFRTQKTCSPCRFNVRGEKIEVPHQLKAESDEDRNLFIDTVKENDPSQGYFYSYQYKNLTGSMNELTEKFEPVGIWEGLIGHRVESFSTAKGYRTACLVDDPPLTIYGGIYYRAPFCSVFNTKEKKLVASSLMNHPDNDYLTRTMTTTFKSGNAIVALAQIYPAPKPVEIEIQVLKPAAPGRTELDRLLHDDEVSEPIKFQEISGNYPFEMYGILLEQEYCLVTSETKKEGEEYNKPEVKLTVKCMASHL